MIICCIDPTVRYDVIKYDIPASLTFLRGELLKYEQVELSVWLYGRHNRKSTGASSELGRCATANVDRYRQSNVRSSFRPTSRQNQLVTPRNKLNVNFNFPCRKIQLSSTACE